METDDFQGVPLTYFPGICAAPEAGVAGAGGTTTAAAGVLPGIWPGAPGVTGTGAGAVTAARSSTLPPDTGRTLPK